MNEELSELSYEEFVRARKLYWQQEAKSAGKDVVSPANDTASAAQDASNFMLVLARAGRFFRCI